MKTIYLTDLSQCSRGVVQLRGHPERDTQHRGKGQDPAYAIAPPWVHIVIVILQG